LFSEQKAPDWVLLDWVEGLARSALILSQVQPFDKPSKHELLLFLWCEDVFLKREVKLVEQNKIRVPKFAICLSTSPVYN
jgi:hypothetical protein